MSNASARTDGFSFFESLESRRLLSHALFLPPTAFTPGGSPDAIATADLNRDGRLDLIEVDGGTDLMNIYLSARRGRYSLEQIHLGMTGLSSIAVADFNGDQFLDLAVTGTRLALLFGIGNGTFHPTIYATVGNTPQMVIAADFNGDKHPDLAVTNILDDTVSILTNRGTGRFNTSTIAAGAGPSGIAAGDFTGDGKIDLAVADTGEQATGAGQGITLLTNVGNGVFASSGPLITPGRPFQIVAADLNRDGTPDLITADGGINANDGANDISVFLSGRRHRFAAAVNYPSLGLTPESVAVGDVNGDGKLDVVAGNFNGNHDLGVYVGDGTGKLIAAGGIPATTGASVAGAGAVLLADMNGDGKLDILTANFNLGTVSELLHT